MNEKIGEIREDLWQIRRRLSDLNQPATTPSFFSFQFRPISIPVTMLVHFFERRALRKVEAKQQHQLSEAKKERSALRQERIDLARDKFFDNKFIYGKVNLFAGLDGGFGLKHQGYTWSDDALKSARQFLSGDTVKIEKRQEEEKRIIPKRGFLDDA